MDPVTILGLVAMLVNTIMAIIFARGKRALAAERRELKVNPPMSKCICGITILSDDVVSQQIHVLCVMGVQQAIEAREHTQMLESAYQMNRDFDRKRANELKAIEAKKEAERKALEAPKKPVFRIEIHPVVKQSLGVYDIRTDWYCDSASGYYTKYNWQVWKDESLLAEGSKRYESQAKDAAKAIVAVHRKASKKTVLVD